MKTYQILLSENQLVIIRAALEAERNVPASDIKEGEFIAGMIADLISPSTEYEAGTLHDFFDGSEAADAQNHMPPR